MLRTIASDMDGSIRSAEPEDILLQLAIKYQHGIEAIILKN
jgi:hypothetical protein